MNLLPFTCHSVNSDIEGTITYTGCKIKSCVEIYDSENDEHSYICDSKPQLNSSNTEKFDRNLLYDIDCDYDDNTCFISGRNGKGCIGSIYSSIKFTSTGIVIAWVFKPAVIS